MYQILSVTPIYQLGKYFARAAGVVSEGVLTVSLKPLPQLKVSVNAAS